jgi:hypothetical protein
MKLTQVMDSVAKRMDFLRKNRGKEVTIRLSKPDCYLNSQLDNPYILPGWSDWYAQRTFKMTKYQCDFYATAKLYQELEGLDDAWASLRALFASLGINNPVKAVWQAIPFSFLLDWVAPVGKWLERAAVQPFYGTWRVYDITTSVRERYDVENRLDLISSSTGAKSSFVLEKVHVDRFLRMVGLPQTLGAIDFSQLTQQQQKLFLSLVLTKVL